MLLAGLLILHHIPGSPGRIRVGPVRKAMGGGTTDWKCGRAL